MAQQDGKNGGRLKAWLALAVFVLGVVFTSGTIVATSYATQAEHSRRIETLEQTQRRIFESLVRIETKLETNPAKEKDR